MILLVIQIHPRRTIADCGCTLLQLTPTVSSFQSLGQTRRGHVAHILRIGALHIIEAITLIFSVVRVRLPTIS